jgi:hypothetical protein
MASTYSQYKIELIGTGDQAGTWGTTTNSNFGSATPGTYQGFEQAIGGRADVTMSSTTITLSLTNSNAAQDARALYLNLTGSPGGAADLVVPALQKSYIVKNGTTGGFAVTVKVTGQTGVSVPNGKTMWLYNNGTDVTNAIDNLPSGATVGGVAISTASGTVTSVSGTGTVNGISLSGTVTSSGNITLGGTLANVDLTSQVTGTLPAANGGTGITSLGTGVATFLGTPSSANLASALTDETGTGVAVFGTNPTLTGVTLAGEAACADNLVTRSILKDYAVEGSAIGATGATATIDMEVANFFSATLDQACTFTFSNPAASGDFCGFVLELTNGGAFVITYPASVDFVGGVAPTLTAAGVDQLVFTTRDGGTTYFAFVAGLDIKSP